MDNHHHAHHTHHEAGIVPQGEVVQPSADTELTHAEAASAAIEETSLETGAAAVEAAETEAATPAVAAAPKAPRRSTSIDAKTGTVTFHALGDLPVETYSFASLPEEHQTAVMSHAAVTGLRTLLNQAKTPADGFAKLVKGELPSEREAAAPPKVNPWRQAIANALVLRHADANIVLTPEDALAKAEAMSRSDFAKLKNDGLVCREFAKLADTATSALDPA